jgi:septum formation protein
MKRLLAAIDFPIVLASQSPRRSALLKLIGLEFEVKTSDLDESRYLYETRPRQHVELLSQAKAVAVAKQYQRALVIGADTVVVLNNEILGKPSDADHAFKMLKSLSGQTHKVYTGFTLIKVPEQRIISSYQVTNVHFRPIQDWEIDDYIATGQPMDKAGSYGIQDQSAAFADRIDGCFYNIVGFPLAKFYSTFISFLNLQP